MALVASELGGTPMWVSQRSVEHIGGFLTRQNSDENPAAPHGVNEPGGIPCEHPAVSGEPFVPEREISGSVDVGDPLRPQHLPDDFRILLKNLVVGGFGF